jgi:signal transduction histidine kinase
VTPGADSARSAGLGEQKLTRLLAVGRTLVSELDLEAVLHHVLETARELTGARHAALGILDERKHELERFLTVGIDEDVRREIGPLPRGRGVLGELIRNPSPLRLRRVTDHPRSYGFPPGHPPMESFLGVPIGIRGEAYGNLYLTDKQGAEEFDDVDEELVLVLAEWAAIAIDNARLYTSVAQRRAELERAVRGLEATSAIARAVGFETSLERVLELIVKRGRAMVEACSLLALLAEDSTLRVAAAAGEVGPEISGTTLRPEGTLAGTVLSSGSPQRVSDLRTRVGHGLEALVGPATAAVAVPLGFRGKARGVLLALDREGDDPVFNADDEHLLQSFAASAAIAIATAQSVETERLAHSIRASEQERGRWARELHDETLQELGAVKLLLETARMGADPEAARRTAASAVEQLDLTIRGLQGLITELRPAALDEFGLEPAVQALVTRTSATSGIAIEASVDAAVTATRLEPEIESAVYRLVQEALNNAVKHSGAELARVEISKSGAGVSVRVSDDGRGFDPEQSRGRGYGLVGMRERAELVGGRIEIASKPGGGTTVTAALPAKHLSGEFAGPRVA